MCLTIKNENTFSSAFIGIEQMETIPDVYVFLNALNGKSVLIHCPLSLMDSEFHTSVINNPENNVLDLAHEMYLRLQMRVTAMIKALFVGFGDGSTEVVYEPYYFAAPEQVMTTDQENMGKVIPIVQTETVYNDQFQIMLIKDRLEAGCETTYDLITITVPNHWMTLSEEDKMEVWGMQVDGEMGNRMTNPY